MRRYTLYAPKPTPPIASTSSPITSAFAPLLSDFGFSVVVVSDDEVVVSSLTRPLRSSVVDVVDELVVVGARVVVVVGGIVVVVGGFVTTVVVGGGCTRMLPCIESPLTDEWYPIPPLAVGNAFVNVSAGVSVRSNDTELPSSDVTLCGWEEQFVHITESPALIVIELPPDDPHGPLM
jgi:hypothetical protein